MPTEEENKPKSKGTKVEEEVQEDDKGNVSRGRTRLRAMR